MNNAKIFAIVSHSEDSLSKGRGLSHSLEGVNRGQAAKTKNDSTERINHLGGILNLCQVEPTTVRNTEKQKRGVHYDLMNKTRALVTPEYLL